MATSEQIQKRIDDMKADQANTNPYGPSLAGSPYGGPGGNTATQREAQMRGYNQAEARKLEKLRDELQEQETKEANEGKLRKMFEEMPEYESAIDFAEQDLFKDQAYGTEDMDIYSRLKDQEASRFAGGQQQLGMQLQDEIGNIDVSGAGQLQNAYSQLGMGGGLSGGARERIASGGLEAMMAQRQGARLGNQRSMFDLGQSRDQNLFDIGNKQAETRLDMQSDIRGSIQGEREREQEFAQQRAQDRARLEETLMGAGRQEDIAKKYAPKK